MRLGIDFNFSNLSFENVSRCSANNLSLGNDSNSEHTIIHRYLK